MTAALAAVVDTVELAQCPAAIVYREVVRNQLNLRVLLQEKMPQLLEVDAQPMRGAAG